MILFKRFSDATPYSKHEATAIALDREATDSSCFYEAVPMPATDQYAVVACELDNSFMGAL